MTDTSPKPLPGWFVTGTGTGVGKTWVTAAVAECLLRKGHRPGVIKPVATGIADPFDPGSDTAILLEHAGWPVTAEFLSIANPLRFAAPAAPTVAARAEGRMCRWEDVVSEVRRSIMAWANRSADILLIEGAGGVCCPLADESRTMIDLVRELDYSVLVVARKGLGTLSHTIAAVKVLESSAVRIGGVVMNCVPGDDPEGLPERTAADEAARFLDRTPILLDGLPADRPCDLVHAIAPIDWFGKAAVPRW